jgi:hypothetical protein
VRSLRRALYVALAGALLLGGGVVTACKSKAKPMTELVFENKDHKLRLDVDGLLFTDDALHQSTHVSAGGVFAQRDDAQVGTRTSSLSGGTVSSGCEGSMAQLTADKLGGQILITDTKNATAMLSAAQGMGRLHLWATESRVEMTVDDTGGNLILKGGSKAELSAFPDKALLELETGDAEKRVSSLEK